MTGADDRLARRTAVQVTGDVTDFTPQPLKDTGEPLDFAIIGDGFFAVQTAQGTRYTRNGQFTANAAGPARRRRRRPRARPQRPPDDDRRRRQGRPAPPERRAAAPTRARPATTSSPARPGAVAGQVAGQVRSGALEGSGADPTQAMVDMIASMRAYESGQKVIQTIDETLGKAASVRRLA